MNTGRTGWDRRIEKGASCSVVSSVGLAHEVHRDDQETAHWLRGRESPDANDVPR